MATPLEIVRVPGWVGRPQLSWLLHGFSTRTAGKTSVYRKSADLNLGFTESDDRKLVAVK